MTVSYVRSASSSSDFMETWDQPIEIGSETDRYLIGTIGLRNVNASATITAAFDPAGANTAMTLLASAVDSATNTSVFAFGLAAPATGLSQIVRFTWTGTARIAAAGSLFQGVDQTTSVGTPGSAQGNTIDPNTTVDATSDDLILAILGTRNQGVTITPGVDLTQRWSAAKTSGDSFPRNYGATRPGAGAGTSVSFTLSGVIEWGLLAIPLLASAGAPPSTDPVLGVRRGGRWV